ncbi:hypothetical protein BELL_0400g00070 [Botrytis elliptica]|uniref:Uncharacterized protein n=1 Tax=Botrytis elliptica TaxID=278938 RepID=A0A4Z1JH12_9HELO|nr:hypothetical protein BELL_0400g00070 [Botrytis elliptica]
MVVGTHIHVLGLDNQEALSYLLICTDMLEAITMEPIDNLQPDLYEASSSILFLLRCNLTALTKTLQNQTGFRDV